jgi:hypothetical protein
MGSKVSRYLTLVSACFRTVSVHRVKPDAINEYKKAASVYTATIVCFVFVSDMDECREQYYTGIKNDSELRVKLTGNWETIVGDQDTFCKDHPVFPF